MPETHYSAPTDVEQGSRATGLSNAFPPPFRCAFSRQGVGAIWIQASGELDVAAAPQLAAALRDVQRRARLVVLDLGDVGFVDVVGVNVIVEASVRALLDGRRLIIAHAAERVRAVFEMTGTCDAVELTKVSGRRSSPS